MARRVDAEGEDRGERAGEQPLAARLVDDARAAVDHEDVVPGAAGVQGGGEPDGPAADDQHVDVAVGRAAVGRPGRGHGTAGCAAAPPAVARARARSSAGMRKRASSTALSSVNATAVIQHECTSGSATPSTTTAT